MQERYRGEAEKRSMRWSVDGAKKITDLGGCIKSNRLDDFSTKKWPLGDVYPKIDAHPICRSSTELFIKFKTTKY